MRHWEEWRQKALAALKADPALRFEDKGEYLQKGVCPHCSEPSLWVKKRSLYAVRCNHQNKCGFEFFVKDRYPEFFSRLSERFPITETSPTATADAFLSIRGLERWIGSDWYAQENARREHRWFPTIRFYLDRDKTKYWERLIDYSGSEKANFGGKREKDGSLYKGLVWRPPGMEVRGEIFLVEGILDALSLYAVGKKAVATLSSNHLPEDFLHQLDEVSTRLVIAYDNDPAGIKGAARLKRHVEREFENTRAAFPPAGKDWNDLLVSGAFEEEAEKKWAESFSRGRLLLASSAEEYAEELYRKEPRAVLLLEFERRLYVREEGGAGEDEEGKKTRVVPISNFGLRLLYSQSHEITEENAYCFRVSRPGRNHCLLELSAKEISQRAAFQEAMLKKSPGSFFHGKQTHLEKLCARFFQRSFDHVRIIPWLGYDSVTESYVFPNACYSKEGKYLKPNELEYFSVGEREHVKSGWQKKQEIQFSTTWERGWVEDLMTAYSRKGVCLVGFFAATLFAEQFREKYKSFPFLCAIGEPGTGKSTLLEFTWRLFGRSGYEGIPLNNISTAIGMARELAKLSNLPSVLLEKNDQQSKFNLESMLPLYNGRPFKNSGMKTQGLETYSLKFRSSIVFAQNDPIQGSEALRERICVLTFDKSDFSQETLRAARNLEKTNTSEVCGFLHHFLSDHPRYWDLLQKEYQTGFDALLDKGVRNFRVAHNHALLFAGSCLLAEIVPRWETYKPPLFEFVSERAKKRERTLNEDSELMSLFMETLEDLYAMDHAINHSSREEEWAVNLNHFLSLCRDKGLYAHFPNVTELRETIKSSKRFLGVKNIRSSRGRGQVTRCWVLRKDL